MRETCAGAACARLCFMDQTRDDDRRYHRVEVITGGLRRRHWSSAEKARIVEESAVPGANISEVARRNRVSRGLLSIWRRQSRQGLSEGGAFVQLQVAEGDVEPAVDRGARRLSDCGTAEDDARIEISLGAATIRVRAGADAVTLERVVAALRATR